MEFMLMRDGTVQQFSCIPRDVDVVLALVEHGGIAYYWENGMGWSSLNWGDRYGNICVDPPDLIKLARMLM